VVTAEKVFEVKGQKARPDQLTHDRGGIHFDCVALTLTCLLYVNVHVLFYWNRVTVKLLKNRCTSLVCIFRN